MRRIVVHLWLALAMSLVSVGVEGACLAGDAAAETAPARRLIGSSIQWDKIEPFCDSIWVGKITTAELRGIAGNGSTPWQCTVTIKEVLKGDRELKNKEVKAKASQKTLPTNTKEEEIKKGDEFIVMGRRSDESLFNFTKLLENTEENLALIKKVITLEIAIDVEGIAKRHFVGDEIVFKTSAINVSDKALSLVDWTDERLFPSCWSSSFEVLAFPGENLTDMRSGPFGFSRGGLFPRAEKDFRSLPAGQRSVTVDYKVRLMLPGKLHFSTMFQMRNFYYNGRMEEKVVPDAWGGEQFRSVTIGVEGEMSAAMAERYADIEKLVKDEKVPVKDRVELLHDVALDSNYFAAGVVRKLWKGASDPVIEKAALRDMVGLFAFGTGYESWSEMIEVMKSENRQQWIRERLVYIVSQCRIRAKYPKMSIAGQAWYFIPAEKIAEAEAALRRMAEGKDAELAGLAKKVLDGEILDITKRGQ